MTSEQADTIKTMRENGAGYVRIARILGISENTVKSFCRRKKTAPIRQNGEHFCLCCGVPVKQDPKRKEKKFCSDACRMKWWNSHMDLVNRKTRTMVCAFCGKEFEAYTKRKYCCHECYIKDRFGR